MFTRNRELSRTVIVWFCVTAAVAAAAARLYGPGAAALALLSSLTGAVPFLVLTWMRYRRLRDMASRLDSVLHGDRSLSFEDMDEGELAILASELDKMVMRLTLTADELDRERRQLADALADISHQLKTPLTALSLTTELVRKDLVDRGDCPGEVARLRQVASLEVHVQDLVSTLLRLARLDAGALAFSRRTVEVSELVDRAAEPLAIAYDLADVRLERDIEPGCSFVGDLTWTAEALGNLLKNCREAVPAGGTVTVSAHEDLIACRIRVEDTGPGISDEDLPHVFERFYRGGNAAHEVNPSGVGIGLSLAQALVAAQGGTLTAGNARDDRGRVTGARFDITFFKDAAV